MPREFTFPDVGEGVAEGEIVEWLVEEGDRVEEDQPVAEVETDKAVVEIPSPVNGTVRTLHYEPGDVVPVGEVFVTFAVEGEDGEAGTEVESEATEAEEGTATGPSPATKAVGAKAGDRTTTAGTSRAAGADEEQQAEEGPSTASSRTFVPPSVRRLARELDVSLDQIEGSGKSGRVTEHDVRTVAQARDEGPVGAASGDVSGDGEEAETISEGEVPVSEPGRADTGRDRTLATPKTRGVARELDVDIDRVPAVEQREGESFVTEEAVREYAEVQQRAQTEPVPPTSGEGDENEERVPYRGVRRTVGEHMQQSAFSAPHVTHHDTVEVSKLVETRDALKERAADREVKLTYVPFVMKAVVAALREYPYLNSSLDEEAEEIVLKHYYNIGVAVATEAGLMVPVVERVDEKGILDLAAEIEDLSRQARDRSIALEDLQGSTFSITNFGAIGGEYATPILNPPEVGILGLGAIEERPVAEDGEVVAKPTLPLSLSIDHRVVDGATAAAFANTVMDYLEDPTLLLLE